MIAFQSRKEAVAKGAKRYFTGEPCPKGHIAERIVSNTWCVECAHLSRRQHYYANIESQRAKARVRGNLKYQSDSESFKSRINEYYRRNPDLVRARVKRYREQNIEKVKAADHKKYCFRRAIPGIFTDGDILELFNKQRGICLCGVSLARGYHIDHIHPRSRGGTNWPSNLQLLCAPCNLRKHAKTMDEWLRGAS